MSPFKFDLNEEVAIEISGEGGTVIGRAEYTHQSIPSYLVRYEDGSGRAVESWWTQDALTSLHGKG